MPYKISGNVSETTRVIIFKESDWSIESNTTVSGYSNFEVDVVSGTKTVIGRRVSDGRSIGYGDVEPIYTAPPSERNLMTWGTGFLGGLGHDNTNNYSSPVQVGSDTGWVDIQSDGNATIGMKSNGTLWGWGRNTYGELAQGDITHRSSPTQIETDTDWSKYVKGYNHALAIKTNGTLWSWGRNTYGQLGLDDINNRSAIVQIGSDTDWHSVSSSNGHHVLAIKTDGTLWTWGWNSNGQLGLNDITSRSSPVQIGSDTDWDVISAGGYHSVAIKTNGTLWAWGFNDQGQLGNDDRVKLSSPVQIGSLTNWEFVSAGSYSTLAIKTDGTLWTWGRNGTYGELGLGDNIDRSSPVQVGSGTDWSVADTSAHVLAIKTDGTLWSWGQNNWGELGLGDTNHRSSPVQIGSGSDWVKCTSGYGETSGALELNT